jgi:cytoskeletal protein CcmA (bactofilin family)
MLTSSKKVIDQGQISNRILIGTTIKGDIQSKGDFRIDGKILGKVEITGKLVIGDKGLIEGEIHCENASVSGKVVGKVFAKEQLLLTATARIEGDIHVGKLIVEPGAEFFGHCQMGAKVLDIKNAASNDEEKAKEKSTG